MKNLNIEYHSTLETNWFFTVVILNVKRPAKIYATKLKNKQVVTPAPAPSLGRSTKRSPSHWAKPVAGSPTQAWKRSPPVRLQSETTETEEFGKTLLANELVKRDLFMELARH